MIKKQLSREVGIHPGLIQHPRLMPGRSTCAQHEGTKHDFMLVFFFGVCYMSMFGGFTLPETNSSHLKIGGWKMIFFLGWPIFRGELLVSGSVRGTYSTPAVFCKQKFQVSHLT